VVLAEGPHNVINHAVHANTSASSISKQQLGHSNGCGIDGSAPVNKIICSRVRSPLLMHAACPVSVPLAKVKQLMCSALVGV
jgi:hypothetical protein